MVDSIECRFIAYSHEVAPTTGTPHLQGYICLTNATTVKSMRKKMKGCDVRSMNGTIEQNDTYISKMINPIERGDKPMSNDNKGRAEKLRWKRAIDCAKLGDIEGIDADIQLKYYGTLKRIKADNRKVPDAHPCTCYWIYGKTGTGKSHVVYETYKDAYRKDMSDPKWFDNYDDEEVVYLEDIDKYQVKWAGMLKRLSDKYPFKVQVKGSMIDIRPKKVIVTSNYTIEEIWDDEITRECLNRRFTVIEKLREQNIII